MPNAKWMTLPLVLLILLSQLALPATAFADDTNPPPVGTEEAVATEEAVSTDEPVGTEEAVVTEEAVSTEEADTTEEEVTIAEALEQLPEDTHIAVINEDGSLEPLATEEAADIIAEADPIWCPNGLSPTTANSLHILGISSHYFTSCLGHPPTSLSESL